MLRLTSSSIPYFLAYHAKSLSKTMIPTIKSALSAFIDRSVIVCNYADFVTACSNADIYSCVHTDYPVKLFAEARYFLDNYLTTGELPICYQDSVRKTIRLFGLEMCYLTVFLRQLMKDDTIIVIPSFPVAFLKLQSQTAEPLINFRRFDKGDYSFNDWLPVAGKLYEDMPWSTYLEYKAYLAPALEDNMSFASYIAAQTTSLVSNDFDTFYLWEEIA